MPKVPTYDNFQAAPNAFTTARVQDTVTSDLTSAGGRQMQQMGRSVADFGGKMGNIALDMQQQANSLRVQDALNQAREAANMLTYDKEQGFTNLRGRDALDRPNGQPLAMEYAERYKSRLAEIGSSLGNDAQRMAFNQHADQLAEGFHSNVMSHEGQQFRDYAMSVQDGTIKLRAQDIATNYSNPDVVNSAVDDIRASAYDLARMKGMSATEAEAHVKTLLSSAHVTAIKSALQNDNPVYADKYMKQYSRDMTADDILSVRGVLDKHLDSVVSRQVVDDVFKTTSRQLDPTGADRAFHILLNTESGGRQLDAQGKPLTSSAGAIGVAQVMPSMAPAAAKLAGMEWDEELYKTDPIYNSQLGRALFEDALKANGGNLPKAYAEYNAGRPALNRAEKMAKEQGGSWLQYMPQETRAYVTKNMTEYQQGGGAPKRPSLSEVQQTIAERVGSDNPERLQTALQLAEQRYNAETKAIEQRQTEAVSTAMQHIIDNGGNYASLPADIRSAIPPDKVGGIIDFAKKLGAGQDTSTDWSLYYVLKSDPAMLGQTNLMAYRSKLNETEFKELVNAQQEVRRGGGVSQVRSIRDTMEQYLTEAGINPNPRADDTETAAKVGRVWNMLETRVRDREQTLGRKLNPAEMQDEASRLFTTVNVRSWTWVPGATATTEKPIGLVDPDTDIMTNIPARDRALIEEALRAAGKQVTDKEVTRAFMKGWVER